MVIYTCLIERKTKERFGYSFFFRLIELPLKKKNVNIDLMQLYIRTSGCQHFDLNDGPRLIIHNIYHMIIIIMNSAKRRALYISW